MFCACTTTTTVVKRPGYEPYPPAPSNPNEYEIKFVYDDSQQNHKFRDTLLGLKDSLRILPGGSQSPGYSVYFVKNLRTGSTQADIEMLIQEQAQYNQFLIESSQSYPGVIVFKPRRAYDD